MFQHIFLNSFWVLLRRRRSEDRSPKKNKKIIKDQHTPQRRAGSHYNLERQCIWSSEENLSVYLYLENEKRLEEFCFA
jgi:hypothetical protein